MKHEKDTNPKRLNSFFLTENSQTEAFLSEKRKDPVTGETFKPGDEVVFCASCKSAFLKGSWEYMGGEHCGQQETLKSFPSGAGKKRNLLRIKRTKGKTLHRHRFTPLIAAVEKVLNLYANLTVFLIFFTPTAGSIFYHSGYLSIFLMIYTAVFFVLIPLGFYLHELGKKEFIRGSLITERGVELETVGFVRYDEIQGILFSAKYTQGSIESIEDAFKALIINIKTRDKVYKGIVTRSRKQAKLFMVNTVPLIPYQDIRVSYLSFSRDTMMQGFLLNLRELGGVQFSVTERLP